MPTDSFTVGRTDMLGRIIILQYSRFGRKQNRGLSFLEEYTKEEWKEKLLEGFERKYEMEPQ